MNKERDSYYYTLGIQPGASQVEIKSAFRHLVKLYHADHDKSLDAEMKYMEIQTAYKALLKQTSVNQTGSWTNSSEHRPREQQAENGQEEWNPMDWGTKEGIGDIALEKTLTEKLFWAILGSAPLLIIGASMHVIVGALLILAAFFLKSHLEGYALFKSTVGRMYFWLPFAVSTGFSSFIISSLLINFFILIIGIRILCLIISSAGATGILVKILMKEPEPSVYRPRRNRNLE